MTEISERDEEEMRPIIESIRARSQPTGRRIYVPREDVSVLPVLSQESENGNNQPSATFPRRKKNAGSRSVSPATNMPGRRLSPAPRSISPSNTTFPSRTGRQNLQNISRSVSPVAGSLTQMVLAERRTAATEVTKRKSREMLKKGKDTLARREDVQSQSKAQMKRRMRTANLTLSRRQKRKADALVRTRKAFRAHDQAVAKSFFTMRAEDKQNKKVENMLKMKDKITELEILHKQHKSTNINKEMGAKKDFLLDVEKHRKLLKISLRVVASLLHPPVHHKNYGK